MQTINRPTFDAGQKKTAAKRKALPLHILFTAAIMLGFMLCGALVPVFFQGAPDMSFTAMLMASLAFGSVGGAAALLAVASYDVIVNGNLEDLEDN